MKKQHNSKGFTLIEMLLYMGLLGLFITVMGAVFQEILQTSLSSTATSVVQQDGKYILARIGYDVRRAKDVTVPAPGQSASSLTLVILENGQDVEYQYNMSGSGVSLSRAGLATPIQSNETRLSQLTFTRIGNSGSMPGAKDTIQVTMLLESIGEVPSSLENMQFQTTYSLR